MNFEPSSYDALVRPLGDQMLRSIWRITRVAEDAEDALQEALTVIWKRRERIAKHPSPRALILRICVNCACDVLRARLRHKMRERPLVDSDALQAKDGPVGAMLCQQELRDNICRALTRIPSRQATAVILRYVLEVSYEEIGDALGCSQATARVHVDRARKKLSKLLVHLRSMCSAEDKK